MEMMFSPLFGYFVGAEDFYFSIRCHMIEGVEKYFYGLQEFSNASYLYSCFSAFAFGGNYYLFVRKGGIGWKVLELVVS